MKVLLFTFAWVAVACAVVIVAFFKTRGATEQHAVIGGLPTGSKLLIGILALGVLVAAPVLVASASSDRVPGGAGTYTANSSAKQRLGRKTFRETCASCHTLSAAGARGVYGPNLDTVSLNGKSGVTIVEKAIKDGGLTGMQMPKNLLEGDSAKLVAEYVASVSGK